MSEESEQDGDRQLSSSASGPEEVSRTEGAVEAAPPARLRRRRPGANREKSRRPLPVVAGILLRPMHTIRGITGRGSSSLELVFAGLAGVAAGLTLAAQLEIGELWSLGVLLIATVPGGALLGIVILLALTALLRVAPLGKPAPGSRIRTALAWSTLPWSFSLALWIPTLALAGRTLFETGASLELASDPWPARCLAALVIGKWALGLWSIGIAAACLCELRRTSILATGAALFAVAALFLVPLSGAAWWSPVSTSAPTAGYVVLVDPGDWSALDATGGGEFLPAARVLAAHHGARLERFDPARLDDTLELLREIEPRFVAFVMPPDRIDQDLCLDVLEMAVQLDDDPFVDFEYGYVTGRDGGAALGFARRIVAAWDRDFGEDLGQFGMLGGEPSEGDQPDVGVEVDESQLSQSLEGEHGSFRGHYVPGSWDLDQRRAATRDALGALGGRDALTIFSHGSPEELSGAYRAADLREWEVDLSPAVAVCCACCNGVTGRWWTKHDGQVADRGLVDPDESVALAMLESGVTAYVAGVGNWHGPQALAYLSYVYTKGMRLGEAGKRMYDRLALDFLPEPMSFVPAADQWQEDLVAEGRRLVASLALFGDPAFAPFAGRAAPIGSIEAEARGEGELSVVLAMKSVVDMAEDELARHVSPLMNRMIDYFSIREPHAEFPTVELYEVASLQRALPEPPTVQLESGKDGEGDDLELELPQAVVEHTASGPRLHLLIRSRMHTGWAAVFLERGLRVTMTVQGGGPGES